MDSSINQRAIKPAAPVLDSHCPFLPPIIKEIRLSQTSWGARRAAGKWKNGISGELFLFLFFKLLLFYLSPPVSRRMSSFLSCQSPTAFFFQESSLRIQFVKPDNHFKVPLHSPPTAPARPPPTHVLKKKPSSPSALNNNNNKIQ